VSQEPAFWDSSALVPLCLAPQATAAHYRHARRTLPVVWWSTPVEVRSAIVRHFRTQPGREGSLAGALARLAAGRRSWREVLPSERVRELAMGCLDAGDLRAADALQLAAALVWCGEQPQRRPFLCADARLAAAGERAGFAVVRL